MKTVGEHIEIYEDSEVNSYCDPTIVDRAMIIYEEEHRINPDEPVYLITWSPDPKDMPDTNFQSQHRFNVQAIITYLRACSCGVFCVESSQGGNPHYHGWYQIDTARETARIVQVKVLQRFGLVKITKLLTRPKLNKWYEKGNGLYYYKKDLLDSMLHVSPNPITQTTAIIEDEVDDDKFAFFLRATGRKTIKQLEERQSNYKFYRDFYTNK